MTNPLKGELTFEAGGKTYTFKLGTAAQIAIETKTGKPVHKFFESITKGSGVSELRLVFHAGLFRQHSLTEDEAADLMDVVGIKRVAEMIGEAVVLAYGEADKTAENPMPQKAGTDGIGLVN